MSPKQRISVVGASVIEVAGPFQRHCAARRRDVVLDGYAAYGRWGRPDGFPVLYLGRPQDSVVVEAYRHLIDPVEDPAERDALARNLAPRILVTADIAVTRILDVRDPGTQRRVGLDPGILSCGTDDREGYATCQAAAAAAYRAAMHGLIAPAATGLGETLVLFTDLLPPDEIPHATGREVPWSGLPPDPR